MSDITAVRSFDNRIINSLHGNGLSDIPIVSSESYRRDRINLITCCESDSYRGSRLRFQHRTVGTIGTAFCSSCLRRSNRNTSGIIVLIAKANIRYISVVIIRIGTNSSPRDNFVVNIAVSYEIVNPCYCHLLRCIPVSRSES